MTCVTDRPHEHQAHPAALTWCVCGGGAVTGVVACRLYSAQNYPCGLQSGAGSIMLPDQHFPQLKTALLGGAWVAQSLSISLRLRA